MAAFVNCKYCGDTYQLYQGNNCGCVGDVLDRGSAAVSVLVVGIFFLYWLGH